MEKKNCIRDICAYVDAFLLLLLLLRRCNDLTCLASSFFVRIFRLSHTFCLACESVRVHFSLIFTFCLFVIRRIENDRSALIFVTKKEFLHCPTCDGKLFLYYASRTGVRGDCEITRKIWEHQFSAFQLNFLIFILKMLSCATSGTIIIYNKISR